MLQRKHYISLTIKGENAWHKNGERIIQTTKSANIGETCDCVIRYELGEFLPEKYATILQNEDGKSWRIVKRSQFFDVCIEGKGSVGYASQLVDGDIITIEGHQMAVQFHSHFDNRYMQTKHNRLWPFILIAFLCFIVALSYLFGVNREERIYEEDVLDTEESILIIKVDSVQLLMIVGEKEQQLSPTKILTNNAPTGTAFITTDSLLVTARHCVEYWIGTDFDLTTRVSDLQKDDIKRWAVETETFNQTHLGTTDSIMTLRVFFSISDFLGNKKYAFASTDKCVHMDKSKDGINMLSDFSQDYYWRSIRPYFTDREMALGDILWIDGLKENGNIQIASKEDIEAIKRGTPLMICGYPKTGIGDQKVIFASGVIKREILLGKENLFFDSNINHGFSGGPVLIKSNGNVVAIGIVSQVDSTSNGLYKWAVPITEIKKEGGNYE